MNPMQPRPACQKQHLANVCKRNTIGPVQRLRQSGREMDNATGNVARRALAR